MKALIIDDSKTMRMILARELQNRNCEIREAKNGKEGLAVLAQETGWSFILLDWNMPEMNGLEFIKNVRNSPELKTVPIVMVTTETSEEHRKASLEAGATYFISKPFRWEDLIQVLDQVKA